MEFVKTQRGARALLHEGYRYVVNRRGRDERIFLRCGKSRNCSGCLCTLKDEIISTNDNHNHPPDEASNEVDKIVDSIKGKVRTTAQPIPAVYTEEIQAIATHADRDTIAAKLPTFSSLKTSLYRQRRALIPPLPKTRDDVHFDGKTIILAVIVV